MSDTPTRRWFSSLYWRIALGFIVLLAVMLAAQAASFVWIAVQTEQGQPERVGQDFAELVAVEFESALERDPSLDLKQYAAGKLSDFHRPAFVAFPDGTVLGPPGVDVPPGIGRFAAGMRRGPSQRRPGFGAPPEPGEARRRRPPPGAGPRFGPPPAGGSPMFRRRRLATAPVFKGDEIDPMASQPGVLMLTTIRSHDQYNTTIYGMDDRYRGIKGRRDVVFANEQVMAERGLKHGDIVDITTAGDPSKGRAGRTLLRQTIVAHQISRGSVAAYYPEANNLITLMDHDLKSGTPSYKSVAVTIKASVEAAAA